MPRELPERVKKLCQSVRESDNWLDFHFWAQTDPDEVQRRLDDAHPVNDREEYGRTPLYFASLGSACRENPADTQLIQMLLQNGAEVNSVSTEGNTALHAITWNQEEEPTRLLLEEEALLEQKDATGMTPLMRAAGHNDNPAVIRALLEAGANVLAEDNGRRTALLHAAAQSGNPEVITTLIQGGANITTERSDRWTPLHWAANYNKNPAITDALLKAGFGVEETTHTGNTPLHLAVQNNKAQVIQALLDAGADPLAENRYGATPLQQAAKHEDPEVWQIVGRAARDKSPGDTSSPEDREYPRPTATPAPRSKATPIPAPTARPIPTKTTAEPVDHLQQYADRHASGPGAIYTGDLTQLVGPAPTLDQGDFDGNVRLKSLKRHLWIYESPHYRELLEKAKLTDPTPLTYDGETITIQHACVNRALLPCRLLETYFTPNLQERTNGRVEFTTTSFHELGHSGSEALTLVAKNTLDSATINGGYVAEAIPATEIQNLWGIYSSPEQEFQAKQAIIKDIEKIVLAETGGVIMNHHWYASNDQFLFCREKIDSPGKFAGKTIRSHSRSLSDWIKGMGAEPMYLTFTETHTAIERNIVDCAFTRATAGFDQRWYEVAEYIIGPLFNFPVSNNVISPAKWTSIPADLQQIIIEEAAKSELEALRLTAVQKEIGLIKNTDDSDSKRVIEEWPMELIPFSDEMKTRSFDTAVIEYVIPGWTRRVGDSGDPIITDTFNKKVGPIVGLHIEDDGSVVKVP